MASHYAAYTNAFFSSFHLVYKARIYSLSDINTKKIIQLLYLKLFRQRFVLQYLLKPNDEAGNTNRGLIIRLILLDLIQ